MSDIADDLVLSKFALERRQSRRLFTSNAAFKAEKVCRCRKFRQAICDGQLAVFTVAREQGPSCCHCLLRLLRRTKFEWIGDDPPDLRLQVRHALEPITRLKEAVEATGGRLLVTTSPVLWQVVAAEHVPELSRHFGIRGQTPYRSRFPFRNSGSISAAIFRFDFSTPPRRLLGAMMHQNFFQRGSGPVSHWNGAVCSRNGSLSHHESAV
jgi:hypothetical protein